jgi:hypothetical protein
VCPYYAQEVSMENKICGKILDFALYEHYSIDKLNKNIEMINTE